MITQDMTDALNEQIHRELYSAYLYQAMGSHFAHEGLDGFASWFGIQAREEAGHAFRIHGYLVEQGARVEWKAIEAPPAAFDAPESVFEAVLEHERFVTRSIHELMERAVREKDYATQVMLQWFVTEQVEEEATAESLLEKARRIGGDGRGLYLLDKELGARQKG